jgi:hypothetical protein
MLMSIESSGSEKLDDAYSQLSTLVDKILQVLVHESESDSEGYEFTFNEVWISLLKTISHQKVLNGEGNIDKLAEAFF